MNKNNESNNNDDSDKEKSINYFWAFLYNYLKHFFPANKNIARLNEIDLNYPSPINNIVSEYFKKENYDCLCIPFLDNYKLIGNFYFFFTQFTDEVQKNHGKLIGWEWKKRNNEKIAERLLTPIAQIKPVFFINERLVMGEKYWMSKEEFIKLYDEKTQINENYFYKAFFHWSFFDFTAQPIMYCYAADYVLIEYLKLKEDKIKFGGIFYKLLSISMHVNRNESYLKTATVLKKYDFDSMAVTCEDVSDMICGDDLIILPFIEADFYSLNEKKIGRGRIVRIEQNTVYVWIFSIANNDLINKIETSSKLVLARANTLNFHNRYEVIKKLKNYLPVDELIFPQGNDGHFLLHTEHLNLWEQKVDKFYCKHCKSITKIEQRDIVNSGYQIFCCSKCGNYIGYNYYFSVNERNIEQMSERIKLSKLYDIEKVKTHILPELSGNNLVFVISENDEDGKWIFITYNRNLIYKEPRLAHYYKQYNNWLMMLRKKYLSKFCDLIFDIDLTINGDFGEEVYIDSSYQKSRNIRCEFLGLKPIIPPGNEPFEGDIYNNYRVLYKKETIFCLHFKCEKCNSIQNIAKSEIFESFYKCNNCDNTLINEYKNHEYYASPDNIISFNINLSEADLPVVYDFHAVFILKIEKSDENLLMIHVCHLKFVIYSEKISKTDFNRVLQICEFLGNHYSSIMLDIVTDYNISDYFDVSISELEDFNDLRKNIRNSYNNLSEKETKKNNN